VTDISSPTDPEDVKIITLAKATLARTNAREGACVRDTDGRTYAAASVSLPHLDLSAIALAVAMAVSSGAEGLEAVALCAEHEPRDSDVEIVRDLPGKGVAIWFADPTGAVQGRLDVDDLN
jgi:hypothetical protein